MGIQGLVTGRMFDLGYFRGPQLAAAALFIAGTFLTTECKEYWQFLLCQGLAVGVSLLVSWVNNYLFTGYTDGVWFPVWANDPGYHSLVYACSFVTFTMPLTVNYSQSSSRDSCRIRGLWVERRGNNHSHCCAAAYPDDRVQVDDTSVCDLLGPV